MKIELKEKDLKELRGMLSNILNDYNGTEHLKLPIDASILEQLIFDYDQDVYGLDAYKYFVLDQGLIFEKIDLTGVSFDNVLVRGLDFTGSKGVIINPQKIKDKDLSSSTLAGVAFIGNDKDTTPDFEGCRITGADFEGSVGAIINPQTINQKSLAKAFLTDVEFIGSFDGCYITCADFSGSKNAKIDPQNLGSRDLTECRFDSVEFTNFFDGCTIIDADFTGSKGARINPQTIFNKDLGGAILSGVEFTGEFDYCFIEGADFTGSRGAVINTYNLLQNQDLTYTNLTDAIVNDPVTEIRKSLEEVHASIKKTLKPVK